MLDGQILINREWVELSGNPNSTAILSEWNQVDWTSSALDGQDNLIVVGNTQEAAGHTDILVSKYERKTGALLWEKTYNGSFSGHDYGVSVLVDNQDNVIVGGVVSTASGQSAIQLLKYSSSGVLTWSSQWTNSSGNLYDVPTGMTFDNSGNIIVAGATLDATLQTDWVILKFNTAGVLQWDETYDYAGYNDFPTTIDVNSSNNISVLGFSEDSIASYNFISVSFSNTSGSVLSQDVKSLPDVSGTAPASVFVDANHNVYIAATTNDPSNSNVKLIKVSGNDIKWVKEIDTEGQNAIAKSVVVDNNGDVIVAGESANEYGGNYFFISKYESNGTELFSLAYDGYQYSESKAKKIKINSNNDIFVIAESNRLGTKDVILLVYSTIGALKTEKIYDSTGDDIPRDLQVNDYGEVFVTGVAENSGTQYLTIKYKMEDVPLIISNDDNGNPLHRSNSVLVRFDTSAIIVEHINNTNIVIGKTTYFLKQFAIDSLNERLNFPIDRASMIRVYKRLKATHTTSISRLGEEIMIPPFWATFELVLPSEINLQETIAYLENAFPLVHYAEPNYVRTLDDVNDPLFDQQESIYYPTIVPPVDRIDVNTYPAWDNFTSGKPFVRVGVFDTGIEHHHEDLNYTNIIGQPIPIVDEGWDFENNQNLFSNPDPDGNGHGTSVAGIIGAVKNNAKGIAGIAGGYPEQTLGGSNRGVTLFGLKVNSGNMKMVLSSYTADAIMYSATYNIINNYGYGLHVMNNSYSGDGYSHTVAKSIEYANRNKVIFVASRGNYEGDIGTQVTDRRFPACYFDSWVLNVGGTDANTGNYKEFDENELGWKPYTHRGVDIGAPCIGSIVHTTYNGVNNGLYNNYGSFNGTSASAPHVSGAASLLLSYLNLEEDDYQNLVQEDVEFVLKESAYDMSQPDEIGAGRLNIGDALSLVDKSQREIIHFGKQNNSGYVVNPATLISGAGDYIILELFEPYENSEGIVFGEKKYYAKIYMIDADINHSTSSPVLDVWERNSSSNLFGINTSPPYPIKTSLSPFVDVSVFNVDGNSAKMKGYVYHIFDLEEMDPADPSQPLEIGWMPFNKDNLGLVSFEYSVLVGEPLSTQPELSKLTSINLFPNPASNTLFYRSDLNYIGDYDVVVYNSVGIIISRVHMSGTIEGEIPIDQLEPGYYILKIYGKSIQAVNSFTKF